MADEFEAALDDADAGRRSFLKKLAVGSAFAAPVVSSFTMTGIRAAYAQTPSVSGGPQVGGGGQTSTTSSTTTTQPNQPSSTTTTTQPNQTETTTTTTTQPNQPPVP